MRVHKHPLIAVDGVPGPLPDLNRPLDPTFVFIALQADDLHAAPVHNVLSYLNVCSFKSEHSKLSSQ